MRTCPVLQSSGCEWRVVRTKIDRIAALTSITALPLCSVRILAEYIVLIDALFAVNAALAVIEEAQSP